MRTRHQKRGRPFKRKIHFSESEIWTYRVGSAFVLVRPPDNTGTHRVPLTRVTGMSWHDIERGLWKKTWSGVGPQAIKNYIDKHFRSGVAPAEAHVQNSP